MGEHPPVQGRARRGSGFDIGHSETPITPVILGDAETTIRFSNRLFEEGVFATSVVFPTVALDRARIRTIVTAAHTDEMLDRALAAFDRVGRELGVIARVTVDLGERRSRPTRVRGPRSSTRCTTRAIAAGLGRRRATCRSTRTSTRSGRPTRTRMLEAYCALAVERGIAELAITDHVDFDPTMPAYGFASFADRERDVREAAERWADRGLAIRFGVEVTYERRYEDEIRGWLRRHPHDYVIGSVHISAALAVQGRRGSPGSWPGRSLAEIVAPYFDEVIGAARSGLFDTLGHLDFVKRYLVPHVQPARSRRRPRAVRAASCAALVESGTALEVNASGLRQLPRETYPSARDRRAATASWAARHVTIGSDAHRTEWFSYGLAAGVSSRDRRRIRGAGVPAWRRARARPAASKHHDVAVGA